MKRLLLLGLLVSLLTTPAQAHRSGCHRWHSCPSDRGTYTCGDLGYTTFCGTGEVPARPVGVTAGPPADLTRQTTTNLNLRQGPGASTRKLATLSQGTRVTVWACGGGWCKVTTRGLTGYVSQRYLR